MKQTVFIASVLLAFVLPFAAGAHQVATYKIGSSYYQFVVGSLNEPVAVDDKTGLDLTVSKCFTSACEATMGDDGDMDGPAGTPVTGLESALQLELSAGAQKKTLAISPAFGIDGAYRAPFYLTVPTTVSYRLFGAVDGTPVDLTFTCVPPGTPHAEMKTEATKISDGVTQTSIMGGFGCPMARESLGFPEQTPSALALASEAKSAKSTSAWTLALAAVALVTALASFRRKQ